MSVKVPFCTCADTKCPFHPSNHNKGCAPCIAKNLKEGEIPTCFFKSLGVEKPKEGPGSGWTVRDFAALVTQSEHSGEDKE